MLFFERNFACFLDVQQVIAPMVCWFIQPFHINIPLIKVTQALKQALPLKTSVIAMIQTPPLLEFLEKHDITLQNLIDCALEMYVPHPGIETTEKAIAMLTEEFLDVLNDVNIAILETAAFHAQDDAEKGLIPGLTQERFRGRPGPVADEILGLAIATYIGGTRGVFEYVRFDQAKPGILKKLGSITNDAIGALVAGVSSNVYSRATKNAKTQR
jgi:alpha-ribazole phosphatase CobZ